VQLSGEEVEGEDTVRIYTGWALNRGLFFAARCCCHLRAVSGKISENPMGGSLSNSENIAVGMSGPPVGVEMACCLDITQSFMWNGKI
jgi:hypothetical protein